MLGAWDGGGMYKPSVSRLEAREGSGRQEVASGARCWVHGMVGGVYEPSVSRLEAREGGGGRNVARRV